VVSVDDVRLGVIGLGYVGLPLAVEFGKRYVTVGYDLNRSRVDELRRGEDRTREVTTEELGAASGLRFTAEPGDLLGCNVYIVTVPTPVDAAKRPNLEPLVAATRLVGGLLKQGDHVIYESTVYPGATEEVCVPVLEEASGLRFNEDFFCGYSPERVNPGDRLHRLTTITKVTSGSTPEAAEFVDRLYGSIVEAGTYRASSIKVAEAAKVIENTQRDLNIALVNELAMLFNGLGLDSKEVLEAAGTKWNFLPFRPGLVGGHCIGVDPYYLTHKAQEIGYHPEVILAGRRINDGMGGYVANQVLRLMTDKGISPVGARVLVLGLAFKEDCPDVRNTRVVDVIRELARYNIDVEVHDPCVAAEEAEREHGIRLTPELEPGRYDAIVLAVAHRQFADLGPEALRGLGRNGCVLYDVKGMLPRDAVDGRL
jgi:UDP-N-acetyl-D-galactosamine dehydrogenase